MTTALWSALTVHKRVGGCVSAFNKSLRFRDCVRPLYLVIKRDYHIFKNVEILYAGFESKF